MSVLENERARDAQLQAQVDYPSVYPYARAFCIPRLKALPKLDNFWRQRGPAETSEFTGDVTGVLSPVQTTVYGGYTDRHLWFGWVCHEPNVRQIRALYHRPPIHRDDHVSLSLDTAHDHRGLIRFRVNPLGIKQTARGTAGRGNRYWEKKDAVSDVTLDWDAEGAILEDKWVATMAIPFESLGVAGPPKEGARGAFDPDFDGVASPGRMAAGTWGVNFERNRVPGQMPASKWNSTYRSGCTPWAFGDLYFGKPPVALERIGFGALSGSGGQADVWIRSLSPRAAKVTVLMDTFTDAGLAHYSSSRARAAVPGGEGCRVSLPYELDVDSWADVRVRLRILGEKKELFHEGTYLFGYENGQKLTVSFPGQAAARNPKPGEKDFMDKKRRYIIGRLPEFERGTTAQGALARIARFIHGLYEDENDRLLGATFFVHNKAIMVYSNLETELVHQLTPLSILRFGSAQCCCHAAVLMGILEKMEIGNTGRTYTCHRIGLEGHVVTVVDLKGRLTLLDPSVGRFWYLRDDKTLATAEEITKDIALADRAGKHMRRYFEGDAARFVYYDYGVGIWPTGAPAE